MWRQGVVSVSFLAAIALVIVLNRRAAGSGDSPAEPQFHFTDITAEAGIDFVHHGPILDPKIDNIAPLVGSLGASVTVADVNNDGWPDLYFTNSRFGYPNALYLNRGDGTFVDTARAAGLADVNRPGEGVSMGAAWGDFDNDGHVDLFVAGVRRNQLLRNRGDGGFDDVTARAGIASGEWSVAAGWLDYDNDGLLDLFVVNYVQWTPATNRACRDEVRDIAIFCHPRTFQGLPNRLYRNRGDGTFEDVSARAGIFAHAGKGMSVAFGDFDRDGRVDIFVTNDTVPNYLFHNNGDGTFSDVALAAGVSVPDTGRPVSAMGADVADYDNDGWDDILFAALTGETFPLFRNDRHGAFVETTQASGVAGLTVKASGWCAIAPDVDNDGWPDIFTANSHVNDRIGDFEAVAWKQANSLLMNDGHGRFSDATAASGLARGVAVHRGCGVADLDGDGRLDVVVLSLGSPAEIWKNESAPENRWLNVRLAGTKSNRDGIGARVTVGNQSRTMSTARGYASSSHAGVHFGLGPRTATVRVEVQWPSGTKQVVENVKTNQTIEIREP